MNFTKMQGCGNDYVYVNCFEEKIDDRPALARRVSNRHFGVGSDGLICICPSDIADFQMDMYNLDGTQAQMCGNGIRCVGKYVYDHGMTGRTEITVESHGVVKNLQLQPGPDGKIATVRVDMDAQRLEDRLDRALELEEACVLAVLSEREHGLLARELFALLREIDRR